MRLARRILLLASTLLAANCLLAALAGAQNALPAIKWRTVGEGNSPSVTQFERHFIYSSADMQMWWKKTSGQAPQTVPYAIDYNKEFAVAIHLGTRNTGGYSVYVETVARSTPASGIIKYVELTPGKGGGTTQALTSPFVIIAIERPGVHDWQFSGSKRERPRDFIGGGSCCNCGRCKKKPANIVWNPTPLGNWSTDNNQGVRVIGPVPFLDYMRGDDSQIRRPEAVILRSEEEYKLHWARHLGDRRADLPSGVDWRKEQLLALHLGVQTEPGWSVKVIGVERKYFGGVEVLYSVGQPSLLGRPSNYRTSPYAIIRMTRLSEPISFRQVWDLGSGCGCCKDCK